MPRHARPVGGLLLGALAAAFAAACGEDGTLVNLRPKLEATPEVGTELSFEPVVLTRSEARPKSITIKNTGEGVLELGRPTIEGQGSDAFDFVSWPTTLAPNQKGELIVRFRPGSPGEMRVTVKLTSNDPERREVTWPIVGVAREPCLLYADQSYMFFSIGDRRSIKLTSLTTSDCQIDRISLDRRVFPIVDEPPLPLVVPAGGSITIEVEHRPVASRQPGPPVRELTFYELEGGILTVMLEGEPPLYGCLSAQPLEIVFPQTEIGEIRSGPPITVSNRCGEAATVVSAVMSRGWESFFVATPTTFPVTVPARGSVRIAVNYSPIGLFDPGLLTINTNDAAAPQFKVRLNGSTALPQITFFPAQLDFGTVIHRTASSTQRSECSSAIRQVDIYSSGSAPLLINRLEIDPMFDGFFDVTGVLVNGIPVPAFNNPFTIPVGQKAEVTLQFYPSRVAPAEHLGRLNIRHNASAEPAVVELHGLAVADGPAQDHFEQLEGPKADILWVIDNSCSMYDEQARLISNLSRFVGYADSLQSDYQMGVIVTDSRSSQAGVLEECYPHPRIIGHDYPEREAAFRCVFEVGTNGPYLEAGLGAARQALLRAQDTLDMTNPNAGFLRADASLAIVIMSDEEDQSIESNELLRDYFFSIKGRNRVKVHAIAGPTREACPLSSRADPGYRYEWMTRQTGGQFHSICLEDWGPVLESLGLNVFQPIDEWQLSQAAVPSSVSVTVDGVPVIWNENSGFTYDASTNSVRFHGAAIPGPGERIDVNYLGNCRP
jgi:hypothetical protein